MAFVIDNPNIRKSERRVPQFEDEVLERLRVRLLDEYGLFPSVLIEARQVRDALRPGGPPPPRGPRQKWRRQQGWRGAHGRGPQDGRGPQTSQGAEGPKRPREVDLLVCGPTGLFFLEVNSHEHVRGHAVALVLVRDVFGKAADSSDLRRHLNQEARARRRRCQRSDTPRSLKR